MYPKKLPILETERLKLRPMDERDVWPLYDIYRSPEAMRYWSWLPFESPDQAWTFLHQINEANERGSLMEWGVELKSEHRIIAAFAFHSPQDSSRRTEVGYAMNSLYWRQGLASELLARVIKYAFEEAKWHRLEADAHPDNAASIALLEKMGFQREGYLRERWIVDGTVSDSIVFGLLEKDYFGKSK